MELEVSYCDVRVQHINHNAAGNPLDMIKEKGELKSAEKILTTELEYLFTQYPSFQRKIYLVLSPLVLFSKL